MPGAKGLLPTYKQAYVVLNLLPLALLQYQKGVNMKVLVTGVKGQLGFDVVNELKEKNIEAVGVDIEEMDITRLL